MSNCTPCTPAIDELPIFCDPHPATTIAKRILVEDEAFCQKALTTPDSPSVLIRDSLGNITWESGQNGNYLTVKSGEPVFENLPDGSSSNPLSYPSLQQNTGTTDERILTQQSTGVVRNWRPSGSTATPRLLFDKNTQWEIGTLNSLLPSGQGIIVRDTSNNLVVVPNGVSGSSLQMVGTNIQFVAAPQNQFPGGHIYGLILSNNGSDPNNDVDISTGECRSSDNTVDLLLTSALTKRSDAPWAAGTNQGGMDVGVKPNNGTLHVYIITNGTTQDAIFSTSAISPALPGGYTKFRRIGAVTTDGSGNIRAFVQVGDRFLYKTLVQDIKDGNANSGGALYTLSVPSGIKVYPIINISVNANIYWKVYDPDQIYPSTMAPSAFNNLATNYVGDGYGVSYGMFHPFGIMTNTIREIGVDVGSTTASIIDIDTHGYIDSRGRLQP